MNQIYTWLHKCKDCIEIVNTSLTSIKVFGIKNLSEDDIKMLDTIADNLTVAISRIELIKQGKRTSRIT